MKKYHNRLFMVTTMMFAMIAFTPNSCNVNAMGEKQKDVSPIQVDILTVKGCQITSPTTKKIITISRGKNIPIVINTIYIESKEEAREKIFYGSPTVRMDGLDIEPHMRNSTKYGMW